MEHALSPSSSGRQTWWATGCAVSCAVFLAVGEILQHGFDMQPCSWCVLQRLVFLLVGICCALAAFASSVRWLRVGLAGLASVLSLSGLAAAIHQQTVASKSASCLLTLADRIVMSLSLHELAPWMFMPTAPCNEANVPLLGVPFAVWSGLAFALLAVTSGWVGWRSVTGERAQR